MEKKLAKVLNNQQYEYAASIISKSRVAIESSGNYTSGGLYCCAATLVVYLPLDEFSRMSAGDDVAVKIRKQILNAARLVEPPKDQGFDLLGIRFEYDDSFDIDVEVKTESPILLNEEYLNSQIQKCREKISSGDFDGVITSSRALLESILIKIIEDCGQQAESEGNLVRLFRQTTKLLKLDPVLHDSESVKQILSGFSSIISGMSNYRNEYSDAHGKSKNHNTILKKRHAFLAINSVLTIGNYLIALVNDKK